MPLLNFLIYRQFHRHFIDIEDVAEMTSQITAILFDMGGTLRRTTGRTPEERRDFIRQMMALVGASAVEDEFFDLLTGRARAYKQWAEETLVELNERDLWTKWLLPDWPAEQIGPMAIQLNQLYRQATGLRVAFPESREVLLELFRRGYQLGLVSNTTSSIEVPALLKELGIAGCFDAVVLSSVVGKRKPDPAILLEAAHRMHVSPGQCAYIGDRPDRDVAAAQKAGFASAIILRDVQKRNGQPQGGYSPAPDQFVDHLTEVLELFPPRQAPPPEKTYRVSLSTMWAIKNFPTLSDFFEYTRRAGFSGIELNHKVNSAMLDGLDLERYPFSSIHEPCPADISADELKKRDWLVSSLDETRRQEGVKAIKNSIALAHKLGVPAIIMHIGHAHPDLEPEKKLRSLFEAGQYMNEEYRKIHSQMIAKRTELAGAGFEAVRQSVIDLLEYARPFGIQLGIENRYHYMEYPSPDELELLLSLAGPDRLGLIYDVGHAQALFKLDFYAQDEWLKRFAARIIGTHLHDMVGVTDHYAPGLGDIDFDQVAACLPERAFRTCEFQALNSPEQVIKGLKFLAEHGCITTL
jgi:HAD superfamily hydrolase (TIGR01549 family)